MFGGNQDAASAEMVERNPSYRRGDLSEEVWKKISHLLAQGGSRGGRWREHRQVVNGILWKPDVLVAYAFLLMVRAGGVGRARAVRRRSR